MKKKLLCYSVLFMQFLSCLSARAMEEDRIVVNPADCTRWILRKGQILVGPKTSLKPINTGYVVTAMLWHPDGEYAVVGGEDGKVRIYKAASFKKAISEYDFGQPVKELVWVASARKVYSIQGESRAEMHQFDQ